MIEDTKDKSYRVDAWYADISQVQNMEQFRAEIRRFLDSACEKEPEIIHEVRFYD